MIKNVTGRVFLLSLVISPPLQWYLDQVSVRSYISCYLYFQLPDFFLSARYLPDLMLDIVFISLEIWTWQAKPSCVSKKKMGDTLLKS